MVDLASFPAKVRNVALIGHLHHGKTSFMDMLFLQCHTVKWDLESDMRYLDSQNLERSRGLSIKAKPLSLVLPNVHGTSMLLNLYDTPGHVNFSDEVTAALRIADGAVIVVDAVEGVMVQTERMLRHAIQERVPFTVVINKVDRLILELKLPPTDAYFKLRHTLDEINTIASAASLGRQDVRVSPELGNVAFASSQGGWCFTLQSYAKLYTDTYGASWLGGRGACGRRRTWPNRTAALTCPPLCFVGTAAGPTLPPSPSHFERDSQWRVRGRLCQAPLGRHLL